MCGMMVKVTAVMSDFQTENRVAPRIKSGACFFLKMP
jgi:hypothetical protein